MTTPKINDKERKVLEALSDGYHPDEWSAYYFRGIVASTKLTLPEVRRACRSLAKKGLAKYERGLFNEDGEAAGSGYRATDEGVALISPCDLCGKRATYDYNVEKDGSFTMNDDEETRRVLECEKHYKQSAERAAQISLPV
jgi:hypothetical protein